MDENRKNAFTQARFKLSQNLVDVEVICEYLIASGELTQAQKETVIAKGVRNQQNSQLLSLLSVRGNSAYDKFRDAMKEVEAPQYLRDLLPNFAVRFDSALLELIFH